ncbi:MAG TPA: adventurous gliding motility protein GltG [Myxococcales bacterium]|nr:adventurous gliding motility protein GltG [Myxococcales bacterium]
MPTPVTLKVFKGESLVATREFNLDIIKIGRLSAANLCLDDDRVSRIHSVIDTSTGGNISILDMGSAEGTYVNGKRVNKGVLSSGDEIRLGNTRLVLAVGAAAESASLQPLAETPTISVAPELLSSPQVPAAAPNGTHPPVVESAVQPLQPAVALAAAAVPVAAEAAVAAAPPRPAGASRRRAGIDTAADDGADDGVEVRVFWGETLLGSTFQAHPKEILIGESEACDFQLPGQGLPVADFPIVESAGSELQLVFSSSMDGEVQFPDEAPKRLRDLVTARQAPPHGEISGCHAVALPSGSFAWVGLETLRVEVEAKPVPRRVVAPFWQGLDFRYLNLLLVFGFGMLAFIITAAMTPLDTDTIADDLFRNPSAMAKFIVKPPSKTKNPWAEKLKGDSKMKGEMAEKHKGNEGAMGKKDAPKRNTKAAPKAIDINAKEIVKNSGLMRLLGGGGGGLSTILGTGGLGGELTGAMGHMFGARAGDAAGLGGLGLRGTGQGGGGFGNTIGIGDIGTKGRGGGLGGYGNGVGNMGGKSGSDVAISSGNPIVEGSLDKELIRRVIHQHRNQVRFCYESELVRHQGLNGKVTVKFIISANGSVQRASVDQTTLGNATVESCIVSRVYQWQFPKPKGGGIVVVNYPFLLKESGD